MYIQSRPVPPPRNKAVLPLTVCGCLALVLIVVVVLGVNVLRSGSVGVKQAEAGAEQFLTGLEKQDNQAAFDLLTAQTQHGKTVESVSNAMAVLAKSHGHPVSHRQLPGFYMNTLNGVTTVRIVYQEAFEKGEMPVKIDVISENGKWHVQAFHFQP